jgi:hypothetical protein
MDLYDSRFYIFAYFIYLFICNLFPRLCVVISNIYRVLRGRVVSPPPNPQPGGPPTVGCPRLLIQYIRSYPPYLEDSTGSGQRPVAGCCECGDELSGSCATELVICSLFNDAFSVTI